MCYACICSDSRRDRAPTVCFYITVADLCLPYGLAGCSLGTDVTGPCLCCLVSLGMIDRDGCTSCATLLEEPILSTGKIQAHHLQYHPNLVKKTEGKIVGVRPAFIIHHRYAIRAHKSLVKGRSQACVLIGSTVCLATVTVTVGNRSTGWFSESRPRMFGQHSQVQTATHGEGQRLPYSLVLRTTTSGVGQCLPYSLVLQTTASGVCKRLQYSWVP